MKKVLIVFSDYILPYSPTTLNLYEALVPHFDVEILTFEPDLNFSAQKVTEKKVTYLKGERLLINKYFFKMCAQRVKFHLKSIDISNEAVFRKRAIVLIKEIAKFEGEIIAVDFFALWCVKKANKKAHLVSLEIDENDPYRKACGIDVIKSVIIQTKERYDFQFNGTKLPVFYIQNAPPYIDEVPNFEEREKNNLLFCGSAMPGFGIFNCLEFIRDFPEYKLTLKGAVPAKVRSVITNNFDDLINEKRLTIDDKYLSPLDLNRFVSTFRIGFVFYDYFRFNYINTFNYKTAPSGKLFQYYNAGVPVIGNSIPGLHTVTKYDSGILINTLGSIQIKNAIDKIEEDYLNKSRNSKNLSMMFDFNSMVKPFIEFLKATTI